MQFFKPSGEVDLSDFSPIMSSGIIRSTRKNKQINKFQHTTPSK